MHNIDRTQLEYNGEFENFEFEQQEQYEMPGEMFEALQEAEQMELAAELLEIRDEQELDRFLGNLIRRVGRTLGRVVHSPIGQAIGGALKGVVKQTLPMASGAIGSLVGGPLGAQIGSGLSSMAGQALGLESEFLNQEDREFEGAKQFVRLAANTVQKATEAPAGQNPQAVAQNAVAQVAQVVAPGLMQPGGTRPPVPPSGYSGGRGRSGRWMRRGNRIVLFGV
jgi:hypothetical protein